MITSTAYGAGRGKSAISTSKEVFIILNVLPDGGPVPLDIQYHDVHEALGPISVSLTTTSLTVGAISTIRLNHPDPPPGLNVHLIRVFIEQGFELWSSSRKAWCKLQKEKLRVWEIGEMPYKKKDGLGSKSLEGLGADEKEKEIDIIWKANEEEEGSAGKPGNSITDGVHRNASPFGLPSNGSSSIPTTPAENHPNSGDGANSPETKVEGSGYKLRSVMRLPDDNVLRPSSLKGSRSEIKVNHEMGVEVFFSRLNILDEREETEAFGKPKVQVFSMRRGVNIGSCLNTSDRIHLPPYIKENPNTSGNNSTAASRPSSPVLHPTTSLNAGHPNHRKNHGNVSELDLKKLTSSLREALPHHSTFGGSRASSRASSRPNSRPNSRPGSREPSPTRAGFHSPDGTHQSEGSKDKESSSLSSSWKRPSVTKRSHSGFGWGNGLHGFTPTTSSSNSISNTPAQQISISNHQHPNPKDLNNSTFSTYSLPNSGASSPSSSFYNANQSSYFQFSAPSSPSTSPHPMLNGPKSLPSTVPWVYSNQPSRTGPSHSSCNCGKSITELIEAEERLLEGVPTAPGNFVTEPPNEVERVQNPPPPWRPKSRPGSPTEGEFWGSAGVTRSTEGKR